ncbi:MAG TPA: GNAT family protein [bacterium]|nr:GNAT family protein [bacterium]HPN46054.1 GNAT family protein [bacterium]
MDLTTIAPKMTGKKVLLGPMQKELNDLYRLWLHDAGNFLYLTPSLLLTHEQETEWLATMDNSDNILFTIFDKSNGKPIGTTALLNVEPVSRGAEFGIVIGDKDYQNKGYGTEATLLTIDYGFNIANLVSIFLRVHEFNNRAIHVYEKIGFKRIGMRRQNCYIAGKFYNDIYMDILREDLNGGVIKGMVEKLSQNL